MTVLIFTVFLINHIACIYYIVRHSYTIFPKCQMDAVRLPQNAPKLGFILRLYLFLIKAYKDGWKSTYMYL